MPARNLFATPADFSMSAGGGVSSGLQHGVSSNNAQTSHVASKTLHFGRWCVCLARRPSLVATPFLPHSKLRRKAASVAFGLCVLAVVGFQNGAYSSWVLFAKP